MEGWVCQGSCHPPASSRPPSIRQGVDPGDRRRGRVSGVPWRQQQALKTMIWGGPTSTFIIQERGGPTGPWSSLVAYDMFGKEDRMVRSIKKSRHLGILNNMIFKLNITNTFRISSTSIKWVMRQVTTRVSLFLDCILYFVPCGMRLCLCYHHGLNYHSLTILFGLYSETQKVNL